MKIKIKLNLKKEDDSRFYELMNMSQDLYFALWDISQSKKRILYKIEEGKFECQEDLLDSFYKKIYQILEDYNIDLDKLS